MYQMLIVDDESILVEGIRDGISWEEYGIHVGATAGNGVEALHCCLQYLPDIIIADIKMPEMDGFEFIKKAKEFVPSAQIIIISAFEQFSYAQQAIELGVNFYLVKPIKPRDIIEKVLLCAEALNEYNREIQNKRLILEENQHNRYLASRYVISCWLDGIQVGDERLNNALGKFNFPQERPWYGLLLLRPEWAVRTIPKNALDIVQSRLKAAIPGVIEYVSIENHYVEIVCIYATSVQPAAVCEMLDAVGAKVSLEFYRDYHANLYFAASVQRRELSQCPALYADLTQQNRKGAATQGYGLDSTVLSAYRESLFAGNRKRAADILTYDIQEKLLASENVVDSVRFVYMQLLSIALWALHENEHLAEELFSGGDLHRQLMRQQTPEEMYNWFLEFQTRIFSITEGSGDEIGKRIIRDACHYIDSHSLSSVSLSEVAGYVALSSSYFSKLFKREMGISFIDYVKKARIDRAKHMLLYTNSKVYEISAELGYQSVQYFTTLFKYSVGMTPLEFRESEIL